MNENPTHGMHDAAVVDTVVAEDKESSFMELPPLVEDNDGIGVFIDTGRIMDLWNCLYEHCMFMLHQCLRLIEHTFYLISLIEMRSK